MKKKLMCNYDWRCYVPSHFIRIMKLTSLLLLITFISVNASVYSQSAKMDLKVENTTVKDVLRKIEDQTEYFFMYNDKKVDVQRKVSLDIDQKNIDEVLNTLFKNTNTRFVISDRQVVIYTDNENVNNGTSSWYQLPSEIVVTGKVKDAAGVPLPGVTVVVKGTVKGTITDGDGNYTLPNISSNSILIFSFVGMSTQEVPVEGKSVLDVTLEEDAIGIEEVVAIGYGTQRKADLTGAVTRVNNDLFENSVKTSMAEGLQGLAAGVQVTSSSSQPGGGVNIRIRGISSINASSQPLYVIDGVAIDNTGEDVSVGDGPGIDPLASINPDDIESIDILKDASATAIYGSRGSNGVVLVTTKRGQEGKAKISVNISSGIQQVTKKLDVMNAQEYLTMVNKALLNDYDGDTLAVLEDYPSRFVSEGYIDSAQTVNWQDEIFRTSMFQNANVSLSGGENGTVYYFSVGNTINNGVIRNSKYERTSLRLNLSKKVNKKIEIGQNLSFSYVNADVVRTEGESMNQPAASVIYSALRYSPVKGDSYDESGEFLGDPENVNVDNPFSLIYKVTNVEERQRLNGNIYFQYKPIKNLTIKELAGYDFSNSRTSLYSPRETRNGYLNNGIAKVGIAQNKKFSSITSVQYNPKIGDGHSLNVLGVYEINKYQTYWLKNQVTNFFSDVFRENNLITGLTPSAPDNQKYDRALISYLSRANYSYKGKYLLTASGRYDGSSKLTDNRWAFFPSASLAWRISEESFLKDVNDISNLKLRASYGVAGNDQINQYATIATYNPDFYTFGDGYGSANVGMHVGAMHNPDLRWEIKKQLNFGLDFGLFGGRLNGTVEYYNDRTEDLLYKKQIPTSSGFNTIWVNLGTIENTGIELSLSSYNINKTNFKWRSSFNLSLPSNKVLDLGGNQTVQAGMSTLSILNSQLLEVGEPLGQFWGYIIDGIAKPEVLDPESGEVIRPADDVTLTYSGTNFGDYLRKDISGPDGEPDGIINDFDKVILGNAFPKFYGSISNTFSYKNLELSFLFTGTYGNDIMNVNKAQIEWSKMVSNQLATTLEAYDPITNPEGTLRMVRLTTHGPRGEDTDTRMIEDGSYLRLENIKLSYGIPSLKKIGIKNAVVSLSASNLFVITNYSGFDPEVDANSNGALRFGHDHFGYPKNRNFILGLRFDL
ncbi:TonB-dependent receptor [Sunxiuqinia sp. A32]|uniref:TonB-dependent receptor n=1 Tax=Sunxiuqinia sp. A32 TaxID=3461496 RepID=UPI004045C0C6